LNSHLIKLLQAQLADRLKPKLDKLRAIVPENQISWLKEEIEFLQERPGTTGYNFKL
jgi:hypothetical protein